MSVKDEGWRRVYEEGWGGECMREEGGGECMREGEGEYLRVPLYGVFPHKQSSQIP